MNGESAMIRKQDNVDSILPAAISACTMPVTDRNTNLKMGCATTPPDINREDVPITDSSVSDVVMNIISSREDLAARRKASGMSEQKFKLVHVTVTMKSLTGVTAKISSKTKKAKVSKGRGKKAGKNKGRTTTTPVVAVASFVRNTTASDTFIATHVPSLPLLETSSPLLDTSSRGGSGAKKKACNVARYLASWPVDNDGKEDVAEVKRKTPQSSVSFPRVIQQDEYVVSKAAESVGMALSPSPAPSVGPISNAFEREGGAGLLSKTDSNPSLSAAFVPELVYVRIGLMRGTTEIIPLGVATIVISGEDRSVEVDVPVQRDYTGSTASVLTPSGRKRVKSQSAEEAASKKTKKDCVSFVGDKTCKYRIHEKAFLRIHLKVEHSQPTSCYPSQNPGVVSRSNIRPKTPLITTLIERSQAPDDVASSTCSRSEEVIAKRRNRRAFSGAASVASSIDTGSRLEGYAARKRNRVAFSGVSSVASSKYTAVVNNSPPKCDKYDTQSTSSKSRKSNGKKKDEVEPPTERSKQVQTYQVEVTCDGAKMTSSPVRIQRDQSNEEILEEIEVVEKIKSEYATHSATHPGDSHPRLAEFFRRFLTCGGGRCNDLPCEGIEIDDLESSPTSYRTSDETRYAGDDTIDDTTYHAETYSTMDIKGTGRITSLHDLVHNLSKEAKDLILNGDDEEDNLTRSTYSSSNSDSQQSLGSATVLSLMQAKQTLQKYAGQSGKDTSEVLNMGSA